MSSSSTAAKSKPNLLLPGAIEDEDNVDDNHNGNGRNSTRTSNNNSNRNSPEEEEEEDEDEGGGGGGGKEEVVVDNQTGIGLDDLREAFQRLDQDGDGVLHKKDLVAAVAAVTPRGGAVPNAQLDELWDRVDDNGTGNVSFTGFVRTLSLSMTAAQGQQQQQQGGRGGGGDQVPLSGHGLPTPHNEDAPWNSPSIVTRSVSPDNSKSEPPSVARRNSIEIPDFVVINGKTIQLPPKVQRLAQRLAHSNGLELGTHSRRLRKYHNTFVGNEAIEWLILHQISKNAEDAAKIMTMLLTAGIIRSVGPSKGSRLKFDNGSSLYRFSPPGDQTPASASSPGKHHRRGSSLVMPEPASPRRKSLTSPRLRIMTASSPSQHDDDELEDFDRLMTHHISSLRTLISKWERRRGDKPLPAGLGGGVDGEGASVTIRSGSGAAAAAAAAAPFPDSPGNSEGGGDIFGDANLVGNWEQPPTDFLQLVNRLLIVESQELQEAQRQTDAHGRHGSLQNTIPEEPELSSIEKSFIRMSPVARSGKRTSGRFEDKRKLLGRTDSGRLTITVDNANIEQPAAVKAPLEVSSSHTGTAVSVSDYTAAKAEGTNVQESTFKPKIRTSIEMADEEVYSLRAPAASIQETSGSFDKTWNLSRNSSDSDGGNGQNNRDGDDSDSDRSRGSHLTIPDGDPSLRSNRRSSFKMTGSTSARRSVRIRSPSSDGSRHARFADDISQASDDSAMPGPPSEGEGYKRLQSFFRVDTFVHDMQPGQLGNLHDLQTQSSSGLSCWSRFNSYVVGWDSTPTLQLPSDDDGFRMHPTAPARAPWNRLILLTSLYFALIVPFRAAFGTVWEPAHAGFWIEFIFDLCYLVDVVVTFWTSILVSGVEFEHGRSVIIRQYLGGWFGPDLISLIPWSAISMGVMNRSQWQWVPALLQLTRCVRMLKMFYYSRAISVKQRGNFALIRLINLFVLALVSTHTCACAWVFIARAEHSLDFDNTWMQNYDLTREDHTTQYITALHFLSAAVTAVGFGDVVPVTNIEKSFSVLVTFAAVTALAYLISNMTAVLQSLDASGVAYRQRLQAVSAFLQYKGIPAELQKRVFDHLDYLFSHRQLYPFTEEAVLTDLSHSLRRDVALSMHAHTLQKVPFFKGQDASFMRTVVMLLKPAIYAPGDLIIVEGDIGDRMWFILGGVVQVFKGGEEVAEYQGEDEVEEEVSYRILGDGDFFGEIGVLLSPMRTASVRALTHCDTYTLSKTDLDHMLISYPKIAIYVRKYARKYQYSEARDELEKKWDAFSQGMQMLMKHRQALKAAGRPSFLRRASSHSHVKRGSIVNGNGFDPVVSGGVGINVGVGGGGGGGRSANSRDVDNASPVPAGLRQSMGSRNSTGGGPIANLTRSYRGRPGSGMSGTGLESFSRRGSGTSLFVPKPYPLPRARSFSHRGK